MLYSQKQFGRDQLVTDLSALRERLEAGWNSKGWGQGEVRCILGHVNGVVGRGESTSTTADHESDAGKRFGRMLWAIYNTLYGARAKTDVTVSEAAGAVMQFNDRHANVGAVVLLLDRAIAYVQEQATATITVS